MITRSKMRRQLYRGGGITGLYPRVGFGAGSWLKEKVRKLIPNEIADIAVKAAPFVAPFQPGIAALMRGIGRFDQRGSISDALKQGALTYGGGKLAGYLGGAQSGQGFFGPQTYSMEGFQGGPISKMWGSIKPPVSETAEGVTTAKGSPNILTKEATDQGPLSRFLYGKAGDEASKGAIGAGGEFAMGKAFGKGLPAVFAGGTLASMAIQAAMGDVGGRDPGESLEEFNKRRKKTVSKYLDHYFRQGAKFRIAPENMDAAAAEFVEQNTQEYLNQGGRVGLRHGTGIMSIEEDKLQAGAPPITYEGDMRPTKRTRFGEGSKKIIDLSTPEGEAYLRKHNPGLTYESRDLPPWMIIPKKKPKKKKRTKQLYGTGPNGLPGIPRQAPDGMEFDMRQNGGFQGLGAKEGKDDVPAMLAKNEFVFTADAVRGAGGGDFELGAQRMYDTMKNLEKRMA